MREHSTFFNSSIDLYIFYFTLGYSHGFEFVNLDELYNIYFRILFIFCDDISYSSILSNDIVVMFANDELQSCPIIP